MGRLLKSILLISSGAIIFAVVTVKAGYQNVGRAFSLLFNDQGLILLGLTLLAICFAVWRLKIIFKAFGDNLPTKELFALWLSGFGVGYLTPFSIASGDAAKIYFTKKCFDSLTWERAISTTVIERIIDGAIFFIFSLTGLAIFAVKGGTPLYLSIALALGTGITMGLLLFFYFKRWRQERESAIAWLLKLSGINQKKIFNGQGSAIFLGAEKEALEFFSRFKKCFCQAVVLSVFRHFILLFRAALLFFFLTGQWELLKSLAILGFANLGSMSPVPASLGTLEISLGLAFSGLGLTFVSGVVFCLVWRSVDLLVSLLGIGISIKFGFNVLERKALKLFKKR